MIFIVYMKIRQLHAKVVENDQSSQWFSDFFSPRTTYTLELYWTLSVAETCLQLIEVIVFSVCKRFSRRYRYAILLIPVIICTPNIFEINTCLGVDETVLAFLINWWKCDKTRTAVVTEIGLELNVDGLLTKLILIFKKKFLANITKTD